LCFGRRASGALLIFPLLRFGKTLPAASLFDVSRAFSASGIKFDWRADPASGGILACRSAHSCSRSRTRQQLKEHYRAQALAPPRQNSRRPQVVHTNGLRGGAPALARAANSARSAGAMRISSLSMLPDRLRKAADAKSATASRSDEGAFGDFPERS